MQSTTEIAIPSWTVGRRKCGQWHDSSGDSSENTKRRRKQKTQYLREFLCESGSSYLALRSDWCLTVGECLLNSCTTNLKMVHIYCRRELHHRIEEDPDDSGMTDLVSWWWEGKRRVFRNQYINTHHYKMNWWLKGVRFVTKFKCEKNAVRDGWQGVTKFQREKEASETCSETAEFLPNAAKWIAAGLNKMSTQRLSFVWIQFVKSALYCEAQKKKTMRCCCRISSLKAADVSKQALAVQAAQWNVLYSCWYGRHIHHYNGVVLFLNSFFITE